MATWKTFKLSELRYDQKNYRTGPQKTQRDALAALIDDQKGKLVNLAEDLLDMGPSPGEPIWVTRDPEAKSMYVVLEGNRRLAALKLLENPALADGTVIESAFKSLAKTFAEKPIRELEARVFDSREEALPWQRRRHMTSESGVGLQGWKPLAKARANQHLGEPAPRFLAVVNLLQDNSDEWSAIADVLDSKWTTVDRVLNASTFPTVLGVTIDPKTGVVTFENGDSEAGKKLLRQVLKEIARPEFKFAEIEKDRDREAFVNRFAGASVKSKGGSSAAQPTTVKPTTPQGGPAAPTTAVALRLTPSPRTTLAPKKGVKTFRVDGDRLNSIYRECRLIEVKGHQNAAAFLLRVFIELSSEAFLVEKSVPIPAAAAKKGITKWDEFGINLPTKIRCVIEKLDPTGKDKSFQQARVALDQTSHATFSINTLHGYFHNRQLTPDTIAIQEAWDAWETYLRLLHNAR